MRFYAADITWPMYERYQKFIEKMVSEERIDKPVPKLNVLLAYKFDSQKQSRANLIRKFVAELNAKRINSLMIDSGTYSLESKLPFHKIDFTDYASVPVRELSQFCSYCGFIEDLLIECDKKKITGPDYWINWDRDTRRTEEAVNNNWQWLKKIEKLTTKDRLIPVVHHPERHHPEKLGTEIERYIGGRYPLIAVGKIYDQRTLEPLKGRVKYYSWIFKQIRESGLKSHLLGGGSERELELEGIHSSDATSWNPAVTHDIKFILKNKHYRIPVYQKDKDFNSHRSFHSLQKFLIDAFTKYLDGFGFSTAEFFSSDKSRENDRKMNGSDIREILGLYYYATQFSSQVERLRSDYGWDTRWPEER